MREYRDNQNFYTAKCFGKFPKLYGFVALLRAKDTANIYKSQQDTKIMYLRMLGYV